MTCNTCTRDLINLKHTKKVLNGGVMWSSDQIWKKNKKNNLQISIHHFLQCLQWGGVAYKWYSRHVVFGNTLVNINDSSRGTTGTPNIESRMSGKPTARNHGHGTESIQPITACKIITQTFTTIITTSHLYENDSIISCTLSQEAHWKDAYILLGK